MNEGLNITKSEEVKKEENSQEKINNKELTLTGKYLEENPEKKAYCTTCWMDMTEGVKYGDVYCPHCNVADYVINDKPALY